MKKIDFCETMSDINENYIKEAHATNVKKNSIWMKYSAMAACLCLILIGGYSLTYNSPEVTQPHIPQENDSQISENRFVAISSLLGQTNGNYKELTEEFTTLPINKYTGVYVKAASVDSKTLEKSIGNNVEQTTVWYYVSGHTDMQYLIQNENEIYTLWKFKCFESNEYPYSDVLKYVYQIDSAEELSEIIVTPATMDNTDAGKDIQTQIGTYTVTEKAEIETIYEILSTMTCYGENRWDLINYGNVEADVDTTTSSNNAIWLSRYLNLVTSYGNEIDGLKYTAVSNMFYEYSGIAYSPLSAEQATNVCEILHIKKLEEKEDISNQPVNEIDTDTTSIINSSNEEVTDTTSTVNSSNLNTTLGYITELQSKISKAMIDGELPFVISSAVYENPYRLHIVVSSNAENDLAKLKEFDINGGAIEIEYNQNVTGTKELVSFE